MVILKESNNINLDEVSKVLSFMKIEKLNIFSINSNKSDSIDTVISENGSKVIYIDIRPENFIEFLNNPNANFLDYNCNSMYILRGGDYIDIKNIFASINSCCVDVGRGGSQKAHMISPLDFRLSCYLLAMFNFNYKHISYLNTFNYISKDRYLSWKNKLSKSVTIFKSINLDKKSNY